MAWQFQLRLQVPYFYPLCSALSALLCKCTVLSQEGLWPLTGQTPRGLPTICFPDWLVPVTLLAQSSLSPLDMPVMVTLLSTRSHPCLHKMTLVSESLPHHPSKSASLAYVHPSQMSLPSSPSAGLPEQLALASLLTCISLYRSEF